MRKKQSAGDKQLVAHGQEAACQDSGGVYGADERGGNIARNGTQWKIKTLLQVKKKVRHMQSQHADAIALWDAMADTEGSLARAQTYQSIIDKASRVVVTADLDYAVAHAAAKR